MTQLRLSTLLSGLLLLGLAFTGILYCGRDAEQGHAFADIDKALLDAQKQINVFNAEWENKIRMEAEAYRNPKNDQYAAYATQLQQRTAEYCLFIDSLKNQLATTGSAAGGKNRLFYSGAGKILTAATPGQLSLADQIAQKSKSLCAFIHQLSDYDPGVKASLPLQFDYFGNGRFQIGRHQSSFLQLPLPGILAVLSDLQNRAAGAASVGLNYCWENVSSIGCVISYFEPIASPKARYLLPGDRYEADIFFSSSIKEIISWEVCVNGVSLPIKEGSAHYEVTTQSPGRKTFQVESVVRKFRRTESGLVTDTIRTVKDFSYFVSNDPGEVLQPPSTQYLYAGVDNPVTLTARYGLAPQVIHVEARGAKVRKSGPGRYQIQPDRPGKVTVTVRFDGELTPSVYKYIARSLPDPEAVLGDSLRGGQVTPNVIARQKTLHARYSEDFDFQADCPVVSFQLTRIRPRADPEEAGNEGGIFNPEVRRLLETARPGDRLLFHDIAVRVPGDQEARVIGAIVFRVE